MNYNDWFGPCSPDNYYPQPDPPAHQHRPDEPIQSYPLNPGCQPVCPPPPPPGRECAHEPKPVCTPVPPPIPPVRYVPGMNVQEQMCHMANRVNIAIDRWNQIQANCYQALDQVVGAAVNNDVYYAPDEVRYSTGYDEDMSCSYSLVEARAVDRAGKPIFCHLRPAYNNETNSGARENIQDVSFVTSGQMVMTAIQATESRWKGTTFFNGNPGASTPDDTVWVAGWNRNGVLRFFPGDCGEAVLRQNRMVNCIGPVFPVVKDGQLFQEVLGSMGDAKCAIQAMGWKQFNGNKVFFSCSLEDQPGMSPMAVAKLLQGMGCTNAVITSYQTAAVSAYEAMPISGTDGTGSTTTVPGMTGGMTFLGQLTTAPIGWSIPQNCAAWFISKRPPRGWQNSFTTEVANVVQRLGFTQNDLNSIMGQVAEAKEDISKLDYRLTQNEADVAQAKADINNLTTQVNNIDNRLTTAETNIANNTTKITELETALNAEKEARKNGDEQLQTAINQEESERISADDALRASINAEQAARESADTVLQNNIEEEANIRATEDDKLKADIDSEATTRANADRNLQNAIEAEASARSTKDTEHEARMDSIVAQEQRDVTAINQEIAEIKNGSALPIATTEQIGVIKVGRNLIVEADGTLNATGGGGADVAAGNGITITELPSGAKEIAIDPSVVATDDEVTVVSTRVTTLENRTDEHEDRLDGIDQKLTDQATKDQLQDEKIETNATNIANINNTVNTLEGDVAGLKDGSQLPIASATQLGVIKAGANVTIAADGTLSATGGGEPGETVAGGDGITVTHDGGVATVALNTESKEAIAAVASKADQETVNGISGRVATNTTNIANLDENKADKSALNALKTEVDGKAPQSDLDSLKQEVDKIVAAGGEVAIQAGQGIEIDTTTESGKAIIGLSDTTQSRLNTAVDTSAANSAKIASLETNLGVTDQKANDNATNITALQTAMDGKVSKAGDTMSGSLQFNGTEEGKSLTLSDGGIVFDGTTQLYGNNGQVNLAGPNAANVVLTGIADGTGANDAVNHSQLEAVNQLAEDAVADAATAQTAANNANTAAGEAKNLATSAETVATSAYNLADGALQKTGGEMTGNIIVPNFTDPSGVARLGYIFNNYGGPYSDLGNLPFNPTPERAIISYNHTSGSIVDVTSGITVKLKAEFMTCANGTILRILFSGTIDVAIQDQTLTQKELTLSLVTQPLFTFTTTQGNANAATTKIGLQITNTLGPVLSPKVSPVAAELYCVPQNDINEAKVRIAFMIPSIRNGTISLPSNTILNVFNAFSDRLRNIESISLAPGITSPAGFVMPTIIK